MSECNSIETSNLDNRQFRLNKINEIKDYFIAKIKEREIMSKRLSKCTASFYYFDRSLTVLSATSCSTSISSFSTIIEKPAGTAGASLSLAFSTSAGSVQKLLKTARNKKKKHNKVVILARSKLNSIKSKISEALINNQNIHEDFMTIINEERNYRE